MPQFWPLPSSSYLFTYLLTRSIRMAMLSILCAPYGLNIRCPYKYVTVQCLHETSERSIINFFNTASWRSFQHDPVAVVIILIFIQMHVFANFWHYLQVEPKSGIVSSIAGSHVRQDISYTTFLPSSSYLFTYLFLGIQVANFTHSKNLSCSRSCVS